MLSTSSSGKLIVKPKARPRGMIVLVSKKKNTV
jgi:hypothetical protein